MEIMVNSILVVANDGREELIDVNPDKDLAHIIKSYRKPENRMVCIIEDGTRILRWDRSYASRAKNHWRKVDPDSQLKISTMLVRIRLRIFEFT
ncbi:PilI type IV pilus biogenesis protein [Escherichia coli]|uniref:type IV pilus biogenesis protein PilI n=1 Tax=Escherichia coli TaxID=562 RepID=UPI001FCE88C7|nr:PilI type IV pilus biogenesis protein [Escherichia coli]